MWWKHAYTSLKSNDMKQMTWNVHTWRAPADKVFLSQKKPHNSLRTTSKMVSCKKSRTMSLTSWRTPSQELAGSIRRWELMLAEKLWEPWLEEATTGVVFILLPNPNTRPFFGSLVAVTHAAVSKGGCWVESSPYRSTICCLYDSYKVMIIVWINN